MLLNILMVQTKSCFTGRGCTHTCKIVAIITLVTRLCLYSAYLVLIDAFIRPSLPAFSVHPSLALSSALHLSDNDKDRFSTSKTSALSSLRTRPAVYHLPGFLLSPRLTVKQPTLSRYRSPPIPQLSVHILAAARMSTALTSSASSPADRDGGVAPPSPPTLPGPSHDAVPATTAISTAISTATTTTASTAPVASSYRHGGFVDVHAHVFHSMFDGDEDLVHKRCSQHGGLYI
jgi:hypothetical protein